LQNYFDHKKIERIKQWNRLQVALFSFIENFLIDENEEVKFQGEKSLNLQNYILT